jgi:hypothetical protein
MIPQYLLISSHQNTNNIINKNVPPSYQSQQIAAQLSNFLRLSIETRTGVDEFVDRFQTSLTIKFALPFGVIILVLVLTIFLCLTKYYCIRIRNLVRTQEPTL